MDMDGFKEINDTLGHPSGDAMLREIAERLQSAVDNDDTVARLGGDEFTVILNSVSGTEDVMRRAGKIADVVCQPHHLNGKHLTLGVSIGAALCPSHGQIMDDLVAFADTAMYEAKSSCSQVAIYEPKMTEALIRRRQLESELAQALDRREFHLVYQPQFRIDEEPDWIRSAVAMAERPVRSLACRLYSNSGGLPSDRAGWTVGAARGVRSSQNLVRSRLRSDDVREHQPGAIRG